jgi:hypothetical protein
MRPDPPLRGRSPTFSLRAATPDGCPFHPLWLPLSTAAKPISYPPLAATPVNGCPIPFINDFPPSKAAYPLTAFFLNGYPPPDDAAEFLEIIQKLLKDQVNNVLYLLIVVM